MTAPAFRFYSATTDRGLISSGEGSTDFYHPLLPATLFSLGGFLVALNGFNLNRSYADTVGHDGTATTACQLLQMRAPREPIMPLLSWLGSGRVFRPGAKWRYRWYNSRTGVYSGLSPLPDTPTNIGAEVPPGGTTYLGQTAWFNIPTTNKPAAADTIQLFANTTQEDEVWYLADEQPTGSSSYVLVTDDNTDEELFTQLSVVTGNPSSIPAGMSWGEGIMWPVVKAWLSPSGRAVYFGIRRMGNLRDFVSTAGVTQGSDLVSISGSPPYTDVFPPGRIGQRIRFYNTADVNDPFQDPTVYRFLQMNEGTNGFKVYPELQVSAGLAAGASAVLYWALEDDRDDRWSWISEPGKPWLIDPLKTLAAGEDFDDGVRHWFNVGTRVFVQTKRRIYEAVNFTTEDPSRSTLFSPKVSEGTPGFWSGCETPFGWVYYHPTRGIRVFNGEYSAPLDGIGNPFQEFLAQTQFQRFEPSMAEEVRCYYDGENHGVVVSYVPTGSGTLREALYFSCAEKVWRGPYRTRIYASGQLRTTANADVTTFGNDFGALFTRETQALDYIQTMTSYAGTGTAQTILSTRQINDGTPAVFDADGDQRARGAPVWFSDGTYSYFATIADIVSSTTVELDAPPVREDGTAATLQQNWTYGIGTIGWSAVTAYLDADDDPVKPVEFFKLDVRYKRGTASETFEAAASENANGTYSGVRTSSTTATAATRDVNGNVHGELRLKREGAVIQLRLRGKARNSDPQITKAILIAEEREGALPS